MHCLVNKGQTAVKSNNVFKKYEVKFEYCAGAGQPAGSDSQS
jgi:hypothetical protein